MHQAKSTKKSQQQNYCHNYLANSKILRTFAHMFFIILDLRLTHFRPQWRAFFMPFCDTLQTIFFTLSHIPYPVATNRLRMCVNSWCEAEIVVPLHQIKVIVKHLELVFSSYWFCLLFNGLENSKCSPRWRALIAYMRHLEYFLNSL